MEEKAYKTFHKTLLKAIEIDEETFNDIYKIKNYCESKKRCTDCKIGRESCKWTASLLLDDKIDISCLGIGKIKDKYYAFVTN